jgi:hypothetical protein
VLHCLLDSPLETSTAQLPKLPPTDGILLTTGQNEFDLEKRGEGGNISATKSSSHGNEKSTIFMQELSNKSAADGRLDGLGAIAAGKK